MLVLAAFMMIMVFALAAFSIDVGFITLTKSQLRTASDAASLAAGLELVDSLVSAITLIEAD